MRITIAEKEATRGRIVHQAQHLFRTRGFEATTTRDIARAAGIATGTLFNYFQTKEAIVVVLAADALARGRVALGSQAVAGTLEEELFALVAAELRQLKPLRKFIGPVLETVLSPLASAKRAADNEVLRLEHLELVAAIAARHSLGDIPPLALQVYWALYTGVLAFWANDRSSKQEDTLALLDQSLNMFVGWLQTAATDPSS